MADTFRVGAIAVGYQVAMADIATATLPGVAGEAVCFYWCGAGGRRSEEIRLRAIELQGNPQRNTPRQVNTAMLVVNFKTQDVHRKCALSSCSHSSAVPCSRRFLVFVPSGMDSMS